MTNEERLYLNHITYLTFSFSGNPDVHFTGLLVLNARTMKEIGRAEFELNGPASKPLHGCFSMHKGEENFLLENYKILINFSRWVYI